MRHLRPVLRDVGLRAEDPILLSSEQDEANGPSWFDSEFLESPSEIEHEGIIHAIILGSRA
jgi:hypothetical protein